MSYMKQLYCYGDIDRDPGARVISAAYWALIKIMDIDQELSKQKWRSLAVYDKAAGTDI